MRLFLTGFMGTGKTTVGRELAAAMKLLFVDLDEEIERQAGASVAEIFERRGEATFRGLEREALQRVCEMDDVVVATGGGCFVLPENAEQIRSAGTSVWLDLSFCGILKRLDTSSRSRRPLFRDTDRARALFDARRPSYARADLRVKVPTDGTAAAVAAEIVARLRGQSCAT